jgi:hypothetical protein
MSVISDGENPAAQMQASSGEWVEPPVGAHALVEEADM